MSKQVGFYDLNHVFCRSTQSLIDEYNNRQGRPDCAAITRRGTFCKNGYHEAVGFREWEKLRRLGYCGIHGGPGVDGMDECVELPAYTGAREIIGTIERTLKVDLATSVGMPTLVIVNGCRFVPENSDSPA